MIDSETAGVRFLAMRRRSLWMLLSVASLVGLGGTAGLQVLRPGDARITDVGIVPTERISLQRWVDRFVQGIPERNGGGYRLPTALELAGMVEAWEALADGDIRRAGQRAAHFGYEVVRVIDTESSRQVTFLRQRSDTMLPGSGLYGWADEARLEVAVQAAHPRADVGTERVAVELFRAVGARALFVAGAHRAAVSGGDADVAHAEGTVFQAISSAFTRRGRADPARQRPVVVQVHGFDSGNHRDPDVVVSTGAAPDRIAEAAADALIDERFEVILYDPDREAGRSLAATTNVIGRDARLAGAHFLHLELGSKERQANGPRRRVVRAIARSLTPA